MKKPSDLPAPQTGGLQKPPAISPANPYGLGNNRNSAFRPGGLFGEQPNISGWTKPHWLSPAKPILEDRYKGWNPFLQLEDWANRDAWTEQLTAERSAFENPLYEAFNPVRAFKRTNKNFIGDTLSSILTAPARLGRAFVQPWYDEDAKDTSTLRKSARVGKNVFLEALQSLAPVGASQAGMYAIGRGAIKNNIFATNSQLSDKALFYQLERAGVSPTERDEIVTKYLKTGYWPNGVPQPNFAEEVGGNLAYLINKSQDDFEELPLWEQIISQIVGPKLIRGAIEGVVKGVKTLKYGKAAAATMSKTLVPPMEGFGGRLSEGFTPTGDLLEDLQQFGIARRLTKMKKSAHQLLLEDAPALTVTDMATMPQVKTLMPQTLIRKALNLAIEYGGKPGQLLDLQQSSKARLVIKTVVPAVNDIIQRYQGENMSDLFRQMGNLGDATTTTPIAQLDEAQQGAVQFFQANNMWARSATPLEQKMFDLQPGAVINPMGSIGGLALRDLVRTFKNLPESNNIWKLMNESRIAPGATKEAVKIAKDKQSELLQRLTALSISDVGERTSKDIIERNQWHEWQQWYADNWQLGTSIGTGVRNITSELYKMLAMDYNVITSRSTGISKLWGGQDPEFLIRANLGMTETRDVQQELGKKVSKLQPGYKIMQKGETWAGAKYYYSAFDRTMRRWMGLGVLTDGIAGLEKVEPARRAAIESFMSKPVSLEGLREFAQSQLDGVATVEYNKLLNEFFKNATNDTDVSQDVVNSLYQIVVKEIKTGGTPDAIKERIKKAVGRYAVQLQIDQNARAKQYAESLAVVKPTGTAAVQPPPAVVKPLPAAAVPAPAAVGQPLPPAPAAAAVPVLAEGQEVPMKRVVRPYEFFPEGKQKVGNGTPIQPYFLPALKRNAENGEGWKIHLSVDPKNYEEVDRYLYDKAPGTFKLLKGGKNEDGKDFTIYLGSRDEMEKFAIQLDKDLGHVLQIPPKDAIVYWQDTLIVGNVRARFEITAYNRDKIAKGEMTYRNKKYNQYGWGGRSYLEKDYRTLIFSGLDLAKITDPAERAIATEQHNLLVKRLNDAADAELLLDYGDFYRTAEPGIGTSPTAPLPAAVVTPPAVAPAVGPQTVEQLIEAQQVLKDRQGQLVVNLYDKKISEAQRAQVELELEAVAKRIYSLDEEIKKLTVAPTAAPYVPPIVEVVTPFDEAEYIRNIVGDFSDEIYISSQFDQLLIDRGVTREAVTKAYKEHLERTKTLGDSLTLNLQSAAYMAGKPLNLPQFINFQEIPFGIHAYRYGGSEQYKTITLAEAILKYLPSLGIKPDSLLGVGNTYDNLTRVPSELFTSPNSRWGTYIDQAVKVQRGKLTAFGTNVREVAEDINPNLTGRDRAQYYRDADTLIQNTAEAFSIINDNLISRGVAKTSARPLLKTGGAVSDQLKRAGAVLEADTRSSKLDGDVWQITDKDTGNIIGDETFTGEYEANEYIIKTHGKDYVSGWQNVAGEVPSTAGAAAEAAAETISAESVARALNVKPDVAEGIVVLAQKMDLPMEDVLFTRGGEAAQDALTQGEKAVIKGRSLEIQNGIQDLLAGKITKQEYNAIVQRYRPVSPVTEIPIPATNAEMLDSVNGVKANSRGVVGKGVSIPSGKPISLRTDLPWKNKTGKSAVVVHAQDAGNKPGTVIAFEGSGRITNPQFITNEKEAAKIALGEGRTPFASVKGNWSADQSIPADVQSWTQVGFDPTRHSFYYDKATMLPVESGSEAIQIGNTVFVKNAVFGNPASKLFQDAKGSMEILEGGKVLIRGFASSDVSTGVHELAHVARHFLFDINIPEAKRLGITNADIKVAETWSGVKNGVWETKHEEKFARGFERYMRDGYAPAGLERLFDKFSRWLNDIYKVLTGSAIDIEISPEMREVFDRLVTRSEFRAAPASDAVSDFMKGQSVPTRAAVSPATVLQGAPDIFKIPTSTIKVDPVRFQFKSGYDPKTGATGEFRDVEKYNYDYAGTITLWEDINKNLFVIDGHHRVEMAQRFNIDEMNAFIKRESEGFTEAKARVHGAMLNIQDNKGTSIDVAKFLRDSGGTIESLKNTGVNVTRNLVARGAALANLDTTLFYQVVIGKLSENAGVVIGHGLPNEFANQLAVAKMVTKSKKEMNPNKIRILIEQAKGESVTVTQTDMFGTTAEETSTLLAKVDLIDWLENKYGSDATVFGAVSKGTRPDVLLTGGTIVDVERAKEIVKDSKTLLEVFRIKVNQVGPVNQIVRESAAQVVNNGNIDEIYATALDKIRNVIASGDAIGAERFTGLSGSAADDGPLSRVLQARPAAAAAEAVGTVPANIRDVTYEKLLAKGKPIAENMVELTDAQVTPEIRKKLYSDREIEMSIPGRPEETASFYLRRKADVTGVSTDRGWILKDKRLSPAAPPPASRNLFQKADPVRPFLTESQIESLQHAPNTSYVQKLLELINDPETVIETTRYPNQLPGAQEKQQLTEVFGQIEQRYSDLRRVADRVGTEYRDLMLFDYGQKFNFDRAMETVFAYPFWYLRHYSDYARQILTDPNYLVKMFQMGRMIERNNEDKDLPDWMRKHVGIDVVGWQDIFGDKTIYAPILSQLAPLQELLDGNFVNAEREKSVAGQAYNRIYGWGLGPHALVPLAMGVVNLAHGVLYKDEESMNQGAQYFDYMGSVNRLAPAITSYMEKKGYGLPLVPSGGLSPDGLLMLAGAKGFLGAPTSGGNLNFILRGLMAVGGVAQIYVTHAITPTGIKFVGTVYDQRRVANILSEWRQTPGKIVNGIMLTPELIQDAAMVAKSPNEMGRRPEYQVALQVWSEAVTESRARKVGATVLSFLGGPGIATRGMAEINSEKMYKKIQDTYAMADDPRISKEEYSEAWTKLGLEYPDISTYGIFKRFGDDAFDVYAKIGLGRVGLGAERRAVFESVGLDYKLVDKFYNAKGTTDAFASNTELQQFREGIVRLNLLLKAPDMPTKLEWAEASRMYGRLMNELEVSFPGTTEKQDAYFNLEGEAREQFLLDHLDLKARREMEVAMMLNDPEYKRTLAPYYISISETESLVKSMYGQKDPQREAAYNILLENREDWSADKENRFMKDFDLFAYDRGYQKMKKNLNSAVAYLLEDITLPSSPTPRTDAGKLGGEYETRMTNNLASVATKTLERAALNNTVMTGGLGSGGGVAGGGMAGSPGGGTPRDKGSQSATLADWEENYSKTSVKATSYITEYRDPMIYQLIQPLLESLGNDPQALLNAFDAPLLQGKWNYLSDNIPLDKALVDFVKLQGAENLRGALMLNASGGWGLQNQTWTKVMGTVRGLSDAEVGRLMAQNPELRDLAMVRETLKGYGAPTLNALFDTIGAYVTVHEDGSVSIGAEIVKKPKPKGTGKGKKTDRFTTGDVGDYISKWSKEYFGDDIEDLYDKYLSVAVVQGDQAARQFWMANPRLAKYQEFSEMIYKRYRDAKKGPQTDNMDFMDAVKMLKMVKEATGGSSRRNNKRFGIIQAMTRLISLQSQIGGGRGGSGAYNKRSQPNGALYANTIAVIRSTNPNLANAFAELIQANRQRRNVILQANPDLARYITQFSNQQLVDIEDSFQASFQIGASNASSLGTGLRVYQQRGTRTGL